MGVVTEDLFEALPPLNLLHVRHSWLFYLRHFSYCHVLCVRSGGSLQFNSLHCHLPFVSVFFEILSFLRKGSFFSLRLLYFAPEGQSIRQCEAKQKSHRHCWANQRLQLWAKGFGSKYLSELWIENEIHYFDRKAKYGQHSGHGKNIISNLPTATKNDTDAE